MGDLQLMVNFVVNTGTRVWNMLHDNMGVYFLIPVTLFLMPLGARLLRKIIKR